MSSSDDPKKLLEALLAGAGKNGAKMPTAEEMQEELAAQEKEIADNFKKLETGEIVKMLVAAENFINHILRSDPHLTARNHAALRNARVLIGCILDGKKPENLDELNVLKV
jgi:DNA-binding transcriptional regulator YhcF (GntR family)